MYNIVVQNATSRVPVIVVDATGAAVTGITDPTAGGSPVTATLSKGGAAASFTLSSGNWTEAGAGLYWVSLTSGNADTLGPCILTATRAGVVFRSLFTVVAADAAAVLSRLGTPAAPTFAADIAAIKSVVDSVKSVVDLNLNAQITSRATATALSNLQTSVNALDSLLNQVSGNVVLIKAVTDTIVRTIQGVQSDENTVRQVTAYGGGAAGPTDATAGKIRIYNSAANATTDDGTTGLVFKCAFTATYSAPGVLTKYTVITEV